MIGHLKAAFNSLVENSQWMDPETKIRALEKAAAMKEFVAYPDWILNKTKLTQAYEGVCDHHLLFDFQSQSCDDQFQFLGGDKHQQSL